MRPRKTSKHQRPRGGGAQRSSPWETCEQAVSQHTS